MQLHQLIQSMTKPERRHFRSFISHTSEGRKPKFLSLFDLLCKAKIYDEENITKKGFTYYDKSRLLEKILESLEVFHTQDSVDAKIQQLLNQASILYKRSIWAEGSRHLEKAKKLALKNQRLLLLLQVIQLQMNLAVLEEDLPKVKILMTEQQLARKQLVEEIDYQHIVNEVYETIDSTTVTAAEKLELLKKYNDSTLPCPKPYATILSQNLYNQMKTELTLVTSGDETIHFYAEILVKLCQENSFVFLNDPLGGLTDNYIIHFLRVKKEAKEKPQLADIIDALPQKSDSIMLNTYIGYLIYFGMSQDKNDLQKIIDKTVLHYDKIPSARQLYFGYILMTYCCILEEWKQAAYWHKAINSIKRLTMKKNMLIATRFQYLLINYELGEELTVHIHSVKKYLQRKNYYTNIEKGILSVFSDLNQTTWRSDKLIIWKRLCELVEPLIGTSNTLHLPSRILVSWATSKIEKIPMVEWYTRKNTPH